ncbi:MAG TPA: hypothetical protein PLU50_07025, partial [Pseudobdellovibrionaceae bacterium]|nr:hypothetical protein [Pseudobdellovibrionaceae bacterium]
MGKPPAQAKAKGIEKSTPQGNSKRGKSIQVDSALQDSLGEYLPSRVNAFDGIVVKGAKEHNLKNVSVKIPRNKITVLTGLSGSGKSSLAFDTIYAEGQRRYIESLSAYARQFLEQLKKP